MSIFLNVKTAFTIPVLPGTFLKGWNNIKAAKEVSSLPNMVLRGSATLRNLSIYLRQENGSISSRTLAERRKSYCLKNELVLFFEHSEKFQETSVLAYARTIFFELQARSLELLVLSASRQIEQ